MSPRPSAKGKRGEKLLVLVGRVLAPVGVGGEVRIDVLSDIPQRFAPGAMVYIDGSTFQIQRCRPTTRGLLVKFRDVGTRGAAEALRGRSLYVREVDVPSPPQDTYYYYEVLGMRVVTEEGERLGVVTEILTTGANDVYVVSGETRQTLVPALADVVVRVDVKDKRMTVNLPEGL